MARSVWSGSVAFGLVNVPVKMFGAVTEQNVKFNQLNAKTGARVQQKRVDAGTGEEVAFEDIVKGYEVTPDRYVVIEPEELAGVAPKKTGQIELEKFVDVDEIDPLLYGASYYLGPDKNASKTYKLLTAAMANSGRVGIGRVVIRSKEKLVAVRVHEGVLVCSMLVWADEVNDAQRIVEIDAEAAVTPAEVTMAESLIDSMTGSFDHDGYSDAYREQVLRMIEAKSSGETFTPEEAAVDAAPAPDLMASLEASLAKAKKTPAKKTAKKTKVAA